MCITLFQNVRNHPIFDLIVSVHSCILQGIRKLGKVPKLERLKMKIYQVFENYNYEDGAFGTFSTIEKAEAFLMSLGFPLVRVRYHAGDMARIEIPSDSISLLTRSETRLAVLQILHRAGFRYITLDLDGFRSGSLNEVLSFSCETAGPDKSDRDEPATCSRNLPQLPILS